MNIVVGFILLFLAAAGLTVYPLVSNYMNDKHQSTIRTEYVKEIKANLEQITSLMVSHVDDDRLALRDQVDRTVIEFYGGNGDHHF